MIPKKITIKNFRSIKNPIGFEIKKIGDKNCYILLGINESGKSSILDAISLKERLHDVNYSIDCNYDAEENDEPITITYELEVDNFVFFKDKLIELGIDQSIVSEIEIKLIQEVVQITRDDKKHFFEINLTEKKQFLDYVIKDKKILSKSEENNEKDEKGQITNELDSIKLGRYISENLLDFLLQNSPRIKYWKTDPKFLINERIDLNQFKDDPNKSIPLKNCFEIAKINDVKKEIERISNSDAKRAELEQKLSDSVTRHINKIWKELEINIKFSINNLQLTFLVEDKDNTLPKYIASQRSDGFKHFVSILLNLSVEAKNVKNTIILLDEPEAHLHPSGQKYLRDELLEIAKENFVIFATHSIYMVDKKNLNRHFSIKKKNGETTAIAVEKDDPYKEEVLYEALGTSILEHLESNVLIFEGKTDRDVFELYARKFKSLVNPPKISLISADSCQNIIKYTKFFNTKLIKGYVLFDSDDAGITEKKKVLKEFAYNNKNTFEINDIYNTKKKSTLEDLFNKKILETSIKLKFNMVIDLNISFPFEQQIRQKFQENKKRFKDQEKEELKKELFKNIFSLKKEELVKESYFKFYKKLCKKIQR